jgi:hypothetical protein
LGWRMYSPWGTPRAGTKLWDAVYASHAKAAFDPALLSK